MQFAFPVYLHSHIDCSCNMQTEAAMLAINELLDTEADAKAYGAALAAVQNSYVPGARTTNFKKDLDQHAARLLPSLRSAA